MSRSESSSRDPDRDDLARRYAEHGRVEPPAGLDRMIRARAERAVADRSPHSPARWVGGLATAMALVLAVVLVVQQQAPSPESMSAPFEPAADRQAETVDSLREEAPAQPLQSTAPAARRAAGQTRQERPVMDAADRPALQSAAEPPSAARFSAPSAELAESSELAPTSAEAEDSASLRDAILAAIELGRFERAEALLEVLDEQQPELSEALRARLEAARAEGPDQRLD